MVMALFGACDRLVAEQVAGLAVQGVTQCRECREADCAGAPVLEDGQVHDRDAHKASPSCDCRCCSVTTCRRRAVDAPRGRCVAIVSGLYADPVTARVRGGHPARYAAVAFCVIRAMPSAPDGAVVVRDRGRRRDAVHGALELPAFGPLSARRVLAEVEIAMRFANSGARSGCGLCGARPIHRAAAAPR